jgi:hypothetical protein
MASPVECPNCGLWSPPGAVRCDCGYNFTTRTLPAERRSGRTDKVHGSNWINWIAYALSVLASFMGLWGAGFGRSHLLVASSVSIVLMSVLNTPLTLLLKWKAAIHLFYAYHLAVHCLLIMTIVGGLLIWPPAGRDTTTLMSNGLFLGIYALSLWGLASRYQKGIQREKDVRG